MKHVFGFSDPLCSNILLGLIKRWTNASCTREFEKRDSLYDPKIFSCSSLIPLGNFDISVYDITALVKFQFLYNFSFQSQVVKFF